jgi:propanol-preferring alcohol dehydrogenase
VCGVCHSDSGTVEALFPIDWPRVPGHEVVARIDALGSGVRAGPSVSALGLDFSAALAAIASSAATAIS